MTAARHYACECFNAPECCPVHVGPMCDACGGKGRNGAGLCPECAREYDAWCAERAAAEREELALARDDAPRTDGPAYGPWGATYR